MVTSTSRHLVIAGPGRAGTSLLVRVFTELGLDTGASKLEWHESANAGLETRLQDPQAPYVVKSPNLSWTLGALLRSGGVAPEQIDGVIIPIRALDDAAASRFMNSVRAGKRKSPGGLSRARTLKGQKIRLGEVMYELTVTLAEFEIPLVPLAYPRFARDCAYARRQLGGLLPGVSSEQFEAAWLACVNPALSEHADIAPPTLTRLWWESRWGLQAVVTWLRGTVIARGRRR